MNRPPLTPGEGLIAGGMAWQMVWVGMLMAAFALHTGNDHWQTMVFTVLTLMQMWQIMAIRSDHDTLVRQGVLHMPLFGAVDADDRAETSVFYVPPFDSIFSTAR